MNRFGNTRCLYITITLDSPVLRSQVLNWINVLGEHGITYDLLVCVPLAGLIRNPKKERLLIDQLKTCFHGKIYTIPILRTKSQWNFVSDLVRILFLLYYVYKSNSERIIIQHRSSSNRSSLKTLKKLVPKVKVVFDLRGAAAEEYRDRFLVESDEGRYDSTTYSEIRRGELKSCIEADHVFCVSQRLQDYLIETSPDLGKQISVIPGGADKHIFFFDSTIRTIARAEFGFEDKNVIIYSGGLKSFWHQADRVFAFFTAYQNYDHQSFIVCLTKDTEIAHNLCIKHGLDSDRFIIRSTNDAREINRYYNAADWALLLRANLMTNRVSSPTKAAEYLMAGLPVLISASVGDYSEYVKRTGFGLVINDDEESLLDTLMAIGSGFDRHEISDTVSRDYSKQSITKKIINTFHQLIVCQEIN